MSSSIRIKLFGSLREFADASNGEIVVAGADSITKLRENLTLYFADPRFGAVGARAIEILKDSAFADERTILTGEATVDGRNWLAVLPPVCGG